MLDNFNSRKIVGQGNFNLATNFFLKWFSYKILTHFWIVTNWQITSNIYAKNICSKFILNSILGYNLIIILKDITLKY